ncbi:MAG: bifunctional folylpolyglutamate synthase/dihydrofolate synthase [Lachnospiraceae bacterium]|nr:bifunctional folylpolyglutamate synthase/dihydrofolate synthase [Lachnospiraceae bacterium]
MIKRTTIMDYTACLQYIKEIPWTTRKVGLHRIKALLKALGRPDKDLKFIHVAGTNGKGSVCAMLDAVLRAAGLRTGLFTSPHLEKYNERMKVNGKDISDKEFAEVISKVKKVSDALSKKHDKTLRIKGIEGKDSSKKRNMEWESPSEFEVLTAAGLLWFKEKKCDIVILEVGLGGEFDSTNVIEDKELAIITPIGFDHTAILGNSLGEIASAKAGIITKGCDVICSRQSREGLIANDYPLREVVKQKMEILNVISSKCMEMHAKMHVPDTFGFKLISKDIDGQVFRSRYYDEPLRLNFIGEYQLLNALTVLEAVKVLNKKNKIISEKAVRKGLETVTWAARFEVLNRNPIFILDGAHNEHGIDAAVDALRWLFGDKKITYILGILSDKNIDAMLLKLYSNAKDFITLTPESSRALAGEKLAERLRGAGFTAVNFDSPKEAVEYALGKSSGTDDVICSLGSLYLAGTIRECFCQR